MTTILVIEDHDAIRESIRICLGAEGYEVRVAKDALSARQAMTNRPDLVLLDWMLPDGQGIDLLSEWRRQSISTPIIFLTARATTTDKVLGLELGASDYITKPFDSRELIARIRVRLRDCRSPAMSGEEPAILAVGSLRIHRINRSVHYKGEPIDLVKKEFDLLSLLSEQPGKVFSRDEILNKVWGYDVYPTTRTVDTHVLNLRQKINDGLIETVRAVGYRFHAL